MVKVKDGQKRPTRKMPRVTLKQVPFAGGRIPFGIMACLYAIVGLGLLIVETQATVSCLYSSQINSNLSLALNNRCQKILAGQRFNKLGMHAYVVHDRLCGVRQANNLTQVTSEAICYSTKADGIVTSIRHIIYLPRQIYYDDLKDVRKKRFRTLKNKLETAWNKLYVQSADFRAWKFERVQVLDFHAHEGEQDRLGVLAVALVQLASAPVTHAEYRNKWELLLNDTNDYNGTKNSFLGDLVIGRNRTVWSDVINDPDQCSPVSTLNSKLTPGLSLQGSGSPSIGTTIGLTCPSDKTLSSDEDDFDRLDKVYDVTCTALRLYDEPRHFPTCVDFCPKANLPAPPAASLMEAVVPDLDVPAGQYGQYRCTDPAHGVEEGASDVFSVLCLANQTYDVPAEEAWPVCRIRTTTMSPVLPVAIDNLLAHSTQRLNYLAQATQYEEGDENKVPVWEQNFAMNVTIPGFIVLAIVILLCCCCSRKESFFCQICSEEETRKIYKELYAPDSEEEKRPI